MTYPLIWTEQEVGDWEACVICSGLMALMYGGVSSFPLGAYTQAERETLELVADESMNYSQLDQVFPARYGVTLRPLTTGSIADAVTRAGVGLLCAGRAGIGAPLSGGTFTHSIFFVPLGNGTGLLYDPLAPDRAEPVLVYNSVIVNWAKGAGAFDAREVKQWEFGHPVIPQEGGDMTPVILRPVRQDWTTGVGDPGGVFYTGGPGLGAKKQFNVASRVTSIAEDMTSTGLSGNWRVVLYGAELLWFPRASIEPIPNTRIPATGFGLDFGAGDPAALAQAQADLAAALLRIDGMKKKVAANNTDIADD
jgi:hypothetical protein